MGSEAPMTELHCPQLDLIGSALIEAYRRLEESGTSPHEGETVAANREILRLHELITLHCSICLICRQTPGRDVPEKSEIVRQSRLIH